MMIFSYVSKFIKISSFEKILFFEAVLLLFLVRFAIFLLPFRKIAPRLGTNMKKTPEHVPEQSIEILQFIKYSLSRANRLTPWKNRCLVQAIAGKIMLKRRKIPSTLFLGVSKDKGKVLKAHAWLRSGEIILTGEEGREQFKVVSFFGDSLP